MNTEQIMIRLGVDATAVRTGLSKVTSLVKGWGTSLAGELNGKIGAAFAAGAAIDGLIKIKDQILEITRVSKETGASTNFVQGLMQEAAKSGDSFEEMTGGISKFNKLLGAAKMGSVAATIQLKDMGVISNKNSIATLNFAGAMHNLAVRFDSLNDKQKQAYLLSQAFGKSYTALQPVFERGAGSVDSLSGGNFFTKIGSGAISDFGNMWSGIKSTSIVVGAFVTNVLDLPFRAVAKVSYGLGLLSAGLKSGSKEYEEAMKHMDDENEKISADKQMQAEADDEGISVLELKTKILNEQEDLLENQAQLTSEIADRDKLSVNDLADRARKLLGIKSPIERAHTVTPRMRAALRISNLEDQAKLEWERGNDAKSGRYQSEADQIRAASPWLRRTDKNPMSKVESELGRVTEQLEPVKRMAELVNKEGAR